MGYLKDKYTKQYLLRRDELNNPSSYGIIGEEEFLRGDIRETDKKILGQIDFNGRNVLELGFGRGEAIKFASDRGAAYIAGVDFSEQSKIIATEMLEKFNIKADLCCDDALNFIKNFPSDKRKFDVVVMLDFIEHVPRKELIDIFKLLKGILSDKAIVVINTPVFRVDNDVISEGLKLEALDESDEHKETSGMHCNRYTRSSLFSFMKECGFGAITGHLYGYEHASDYEIVDSEFSWRSAFEKGYPIKNEFRDTFYEYSFSSKDITFIKKDIDKKEFLKMGDYNFNDFNLVHFDYFSMFMTPRFAEFYVPHKFENFSSSLMYHFAKEGDTFIDVGGHYGYYSLLLSEKIGKNGNIQIFEPVLENHYILSKNVLYNNLSNIIIHDAAVSDKTEEKEFQIAEASDSSGFYKHPLTNTIAIRKIKAYALDDLFGDNKVDIVKIDTEGHESNVLDGMEKIIEKNPQIKLFIEFNPKCIINANSDPDEILKKIDNMGLDIFFIKDKERRLFKYDSRDSSNWQQILGDEEYANILCIKKEKSLFVSIVAHSAEKYGSERSLLDMIDQLEKRDVLLHVVIPNHGPFEQELIKRTVSYEIFSLPWSVKSVLADGMDDIRETISESSLNLAINLKKVNPDIVFTNTSVIDQGAYAAKILNLPHVWRISEYGATEHGIDFLDDISNRIKFISEHSDRLFFSSNALKDYYVSNGASIEKVVVTSELINVNNGYSSVEYFKKETLKLVLVGNITPGKGQKDAVMAVRELKNKDISLELLFIGSIVDHAYYDELIAIIKKDSLQDDIKFLGYLDNASQVILQSDIVLVCSILEGFGRVTVEAMLQKKAVIGANSGATPDLVIDGMSGYLYEPGNYKMLAEKILLLAKDKMRVLELGAFGYEFAKDKFDEIVFGNRIFDEINSLKKVKKDCCFFNHTVFSLLKIANSANYEKKLIMVGQKDLIDSKNEKIKNLEIQIIEKEAQFKNIVNSFRWKIPNYFYKKYKSISRKVVKGR